MSHEDTRLRQATADKLKARKVGRLKAAPTYEPSARAGSCTSAASLQPRIMDVATSHLASTLFTETSKQMDSELGLMWIPAVFILIFECVAIHCLSVNLP